MPRVYHKCCDADNRLYESEHDQDEYHFCLLVVAQLLTERGFRGVGEPHDVRGLALYEDDPMADLTAFRAVGGVVALRDRTYLFPSVAFGAREVVDRHERSLKVGIRAVKIAF